MLIRNIRVEQKHADANVMSGWIRKRRRAPEGMACDWSFQYKRIHPEKEGYAGSIEHVDSGYERSVWLPDGERGRCRKCGKHLAPRESHYGKSCA